MTTPTLHRLVLLLALLPLALPAQTTGWVQTGAGPYDYNTPANWVGGTVNDINGIWHSSLTLTAGQTVTFSTDTVVPSLAIGHTGGYSLFLRSDGTGPRTVTLGGNVAVTTVTGTSANGTIGSVNASDALNIDLGGATRTFTINTGRSLTLPNVLSNGGVVVTGGGTLMLNGANSFADGVTLKAGWLRVNHASSLGTGTFNIGDTVGSTAVTFDDVTTANLVNSQNNVQNWNQDFTFTGSQNYGLGTGAVTLAGNRMVTVGDKVLTVGGAIGGAYSLTKAGAGTLALDGANTYSGGTVVNAGVLQFGPGANVPGSGSVLINPAGALNAGGAYTGVQGWLDSGKINPLSAGTIALTAASNASINFGTGNCANLMLGASTAATFSGTLAPNGGVYRLGGGGATLTLSVANTLTGANSLVAGAPGSGAGSPKFTAPQNFSGGATVESQSLILSGPAGAVTASDVVVKRGATLRFDREAETDPGATRVGNTRLEASTLSFYARSGVAATETVGGTLTLAPSPGIGGTPQLYGNNNTKNIRLHIQRVAQDGWGIVNVGINAGTLGATDFTSGLNITLGEGGNPIGTGTDGTPTCPVLPWARYGGRLMTYHATRGLRALDTATESRTYANGYSGPVTAPDENLYVGSGTIVTLTGATNVVNSIQTGYGSEFRLHATNGVLRVTSGAIYFQCDTASFLNANLDFGTRRGYIVDNNGKGKTLQGSIAGTGGLTIANTSTGNSTTSGGTGITLSSQNNTYQGDTHIHGRISANAANFFPNGSRPGDLYVHGYFQFGNASQAINGLNGAGYLYLANNFTLLVTLGGNDANGDFSGVFERSNGTLSLTKTGTGTQRFGGSCSHNGATTVNGGTLLVDGSFTSSAVTVNTGATLRGAGSITKSGTAVAVNSGATLEPGAANGLGTLTVLQGNVSFANGSALTVKAGTSGACLLNVASNVTGSVSIPVTVEGTGAGRWKVIQALSIAPTFTTPTPGVILTKENSNTELWVERRANGTVVVVR